MEQEIKVFDTLPEVLEDLDILGIQGVQQYRAVNGYISLKARYRDIPASGSFELTPLCNFDCKMCYVHLNPNQIGANERLLTVDEWKSIIKQAVDAGMLYASLTGGECLTYPGFKEIYLYLVSLGIQPDVLTNGYLLTEEMIEFFDQYPPGILQVTIYGSNDDAYEAVTGKRAFKQVMEGIERAKKAGLNLCITTTPNRYMQKDTAALLDLLHEQRVTYTIGGVTLQARPETGREIDNYAVELDAYISMQKEELAYCETMRGKGELNYLPKYVPPKPKKMLGLPCGGAHSSFHVNWKGELCPCIAFSPSVHCSVLGNGFVYAWDYIRNAMSKYKPPIECEQCEMKEHCVTCPGEKCMSILGGSLNTAVCQKLRRFMDEGMIGSKNHASDKIPDCK